MKLYHPFFTSAGLIGICLLIALPIAHAATRTELTINTDRSNPYVTPDHNGFYDLLIKEMFKRININAHVVLLPSARALINANNGTDDGDVARIKGIEKKFPNLVRVPETIIDFTLMAFTHDPAIKITDWASLKNYNIAYINGWLILNDKVRHYKSLEMAANTDQLFSLLINHRIDIAIYNKVGGLWWLKNHKNTVYMQPPPLDSMPLYLYLNKNHQDLVQPLAKALIEIKRDGSYKNIYEKTLGFPPQ